jgi:glycosyltransferase involved in cell wall biosynthesis
VNQSEISKYYSIADIFVLPSNFDTWGLVVNEAMNFGLPVIVSDRCGCAKGLVKGNGFIFKAGDVNDLKEKLETLINDSDLRKEMGRKSMDIIKNYSYDKTIDGILNAISSLKIGEQNEDN